MLLHCPKWNQLRRQLIEGMIKRSEHILFNNYNCTNTRHSPIGKIAVSALLLGGSIQSTQDTKFIMQLNGWSSVLERNPSLIDSSCSPNMLDPNFSCPGFILIARFLGRVMKQRKLFIHNTLDTEPTPKGMAAPLWAPSTGIG